MSATHRILLVDDDPGIMAAIQPALETQGFEVVTASDGAAALGAFVRTAPHLLLLDLELPHINGFEVCRQIRQSAATPIIVLSVKGAEADIVAVLDAGADDYLVKPFRLTELLARIRAVLRRNLRMGTHIIVCNSVEINTDQRLVSRNGQPVPLTPIEYAVLAELATNAGRIVTTKQLVQRVWGPQYVDATDYVKGVIRRLRVKLEDDPAHPCCLLTEPYLGYRLNDAL